MTKLAIIIINHNHVEMIRKAIESIPVLYFNDPYQVFVVNNIKDKHNKTWLNETFPSIDLIENDKPKGFASNINQVIQSNPNFDYYLLLNPDAVCLPGMIENLLTVMEEDQNTGVVGPRLLNFDGSVQPSRRRFASFSVLVIRVLHLDSLIKNLRPVKEYLMTEESFDEINQVDWVTGAVMLLRKKALDQVGLFDDRFFLYFEDEDLCCRMWRMGWKVCYVKSAVAYHAHIAEGRKKIFSKANFHHIFSAVKMLIKYNGNIRDCANYRISRSADF